MISGFWGPEPHQSQTILSYKAFSTQTDMMSFESLESNVYIILEATFKFWFPSSQVRVGLAYVLVE